MSVNKPKKSVKSVTQIADLPASYCPEGHDTTELIFPDWFDDEINTDRLKSKPSKQRLDKLLEEEPFEDPHTIILPKEVTVAAWKRPADVFFHNDLVIYDESMDFSDLTVGSAHLLHCEFIRNYISTICVVEYLSQHKPWFFDDGLFHYLNGLHAWRPWYHVYSENPDYNSAKSYSYSKPVVTKTGKYAVRLFWLGSWRRVYVDDKIPVNKQNVPVLPSFEIDVGQFEHVPLTKEPQFKEASPVRDRKDIKNSIKESNSSTFKKVELWPFLLMKAILKLSMLSRVGNDFLTDFSMIQLLTGFVAVKAKMNEIVGIAGLWEVFSEYSENYKWPQEESQTERTSTTELQMDLAKVEEKRSSEVKSPKANRNNSFLKPSKSSEQKTKYTFVCGRCSDLRFNQCSDFSQLAPCWGHVFLINQTRNIPLTKPADVEPLPQWKKFRWEKWATEKGIYQPPSLTEMQKRYIHVVSPFKHNTDFKEYSASTELIKNPSDFLTDNVVGRILGNEIGKQRQKSMTQSIHTVSSKPHSPVWIGFDKFASHLTMVYIFFKGDETNYQVKISDMQQRTPPISKKPIRNNGKPNNFQYVQYTNEILESRNAPLYLFTDSLDYKMLVVTFCHEGPVDLFLDKQKKSTEDVPSHSNSSNKRIESKVFDKKDSTMDNVSDTSTLLILQRFRRTQSTLTSIMEIKGDGDSSDFDRQSSALNGNVLIKYVDICNNGKLVTNICTSGYKSRIFFLEPGRHFLEIWINTKGSFELGILSDTMLGVGCMEKILEYIQQESERLRSFTNKICNRFGRLAREFGQEIFLSELRNFYASYKPNAALSKKDLITVHEAFFEEFLKMIFYNVNEREAILFADALSVLFIDLNIPRKKNSGNLERIDTDLSNFPEEFKIIYLSMLNLAVMIQKLYKRNKVMWLVAARNPEDPRYPKVLETLTALYTKLFSVSARNGSCTNLVRKLFSRPDMSEIRKTYDFFHDLDLVMNVRHVTGIAQVTGDKWVPLTRCLFFCYKSPVTISIHLFCELKKYFVRVFNNDNNEEIQRLVNNVNRYTYVQNTCGYTVVAYGWASNQKPIPYKLSFVTKRNYKEEFYIIEDDMKAEVFRNLYIPTVDDIMCRYKVQVLKNTAISLRVSTSFQQVQLRIVIKNDNDEIVNEIFGKENVVIPVTFLSVNNTNQVDVVSAKLSSESVPGEFHEFFIEVQVLEDTWPLKFSEWQTIRKELVKKYLFTDIWTTDMSNRRVKSTISDKVESLTPNYCLQILYRSSDVVNIKRITQKEDELREFKKQIFLGNERFLKGRELRDDFILKMFPRVQEESHNTYDKYSEVYLLSINNSTELKSILYNCSVLFHNELSSARSINNPYSYKHLVNRTIYSDISPDKIVVLFKEGDAMLKTEEEKEDDDKKRQEEIDDIEYHLGLLEGNLKNKLNSHIERYSLLDFWLTKVVEDNKQIFQEAYESRDRFVNYSEQNENGDEKANKLGMNKKKKK